MDYHQSEFRELYRGGHLRLTQELVRYPDGREGYYDVLHHPGAVTIVALDGEDRVWFVEQYRPGAGAQILEFPAGTLEPGEDPADCAGRELQEEVGMKAGKIELIGECFVAPGYSTEYMYFFLATDMRPGSLPQDANEELRAISYPRQALMRMVKDGAIRDAKTLTGILLAAERLKLPG